MPQIRFTINAECIVNIFATSIIELRQLPVKEVLFFQIDCVGVGVDLRGYRDEDILFGYVEWIRRDNQCRSSFRGTQVRKGNGTRTMSPRLKVVVDGIFRVVPEFEAFSRRL